MSSQLSNSYNLYSFNIKKIQVTKTIVSVIFSATILLACNSNNSTNASVASAKDNSSALTGSGDDMYYELATTTSGKDIDESISIDNEKKTYTVNHINPADLNTGEKMQSTVTKVGEEKILGFNCVHARIISKKTLGNFYLQADTVDLWKSHDVPMQSNVKELFNQFESRTRNTMYSREATA